MRLNRLTTTALFFGALFLSSVPATSESAVVIDSLSGKAEIQHAGQFNWQAAKAGDVLRNNDLIRVLDASRAVLRWDDNRIFVRANSQVRINLFEDAQTNVVSRHVTVFFGALYFVIKKTLPRDLVPGSDLKVYTPTSIVSIRGTSFLVEVDKPSGRTGISVVSGTVAVKNIIRSVSIFVGAAMKTLVETSTDPLLPQPMAAAEVAAIRTWVPPAYVEDLPKKEPSEPAQKKDSATPMKTALAVAPFVNASSYRGPWDIGRKLAEALTVRIKGVAGALPVTVNVSPIEDALSYGVQTGTALVITGQIVDFDVMQRVKVTPSADKYVEYAEAKVTLRIQLVDASLRQLVVDEVFTGNTESTDLKANAWPAIAKLTFDLKEPALANSALGRAIGVALTNASETLERYIARK